MEAAALSGCPSIWAGHGQGSSAPAAAAAATARAADEPSPRAMGIWDRTVMDSRSVPATSMATRAARWEGSSDSPAPSPSDRTISLEAGSTSTSTYRSRAMAKVSKPGPRLADDAGTRARTPTRYSARVGPGGTGATRQGRRDHGRSRTGSAPTVSRGPGATTTTARARSPPASAGPTRTADPRANRASPARLPRGPPAGTGCSVVVAATCWPGHPSSRRRLGGHHGHPVLTPAPRGGGRAHDWPLRGHGDRHHAGLGRPQERLGHRSGVLERIGDLEVVRGMRSWWWCEGGGGSVVAVAAAWSWCGGAGAAPGAGAAAVVRGGRGGRRLRGGGGGRRRARWAAAWAVPAPPPAPAPSGPPPPGRRPAPGSPRPRRCSRT